MTNNRPSRETVGWQWDAEAGKHRPDSVVQGEDGSRFAFASAPGEETIELQRLQATGTPLWIKRISAMGANAAVLLYRPGKLYAALYSEIATGCRVLAQDAASGNVLWDTPLRGLGPSHHSKYSNLVQMRFIDDRLVVFGNESGGKYVEVLDPDSGQLLSSREVRSE